jgi:hypothetical protein
VAVSRRTCSEVPNHLAGFSSRGPSAAPFQTQIEIEDAARLAGKARAAREARWPNIVLVHTPVHASRLNQIEVYFSIVQGKFLTPAAFDSLAALKRGLMAFKARYLRAAKPFKWTFTRRDLHGLLTKLRSFRASPTA